MAEPVFTVGSQFLDIVAIEWVILERQMESGRESASRSTRGPVMTALSQPVSWLLAFVALLATLAAQPFDVPIGPMYWDTFVYFDAVQRIDSGQVAIVDFLAPVGPLGYYAVWAMSKLFPTGQPLLLAQWSMLLVTAPIMAILLIDVAGRSKSIAAALLVPFLLFAALPFNVIDYFSYPGVDGFGIYNRHAAQLLYLTVATVLFVRGGRTKTLLLSLLVLALFLCKVTAFFSGGLFLAFAFLCGRIRLRLAFTVAAVFFVTLIALEAASGMAIAYIQDIALLATANSGTLIPRFMTAASQHFGVVAAAGTTLLFLLYEDLAGRSGAVPDDETQIAQNPLGRALDRDWLLLGVLLFAGLFFETQNTGSHGFTLLWPGLLFIWLRRRHQSQPRRTILLVLIAFVCIPSLTSVIHKTGRVVFVAPTYNALENNNLGILGQVSAKPVFMQRAPETQRFYADNVDAIAGLADHGELVSFVLYSVPSYQLMWLRIHDELVDAVRAYEANNNIEFRTMLSLDFTNILPYLMDREAPKYVTIGADPSRTVGKLDDAAMEAVKNTDLIVHRKCPVTPGTQSLFKIYEPALLGRRKLEITPCFDAYLKN
jgi:hypothetical protein